MIWSEKIYVGIMGVVLAGLAALTLKAGYDVEKAEREYEKTRCSAIIRKYRPSSQETNLADFCNDPCYAREVVSLVDRAREKFKSADDLSSAAQERCNVFVPLPM